ncbi:hypothetical protein, partial [Serratia ficaria]|uniref:hypothetical protein n=1 Tax=Serratia ficaria TaxID=61651 RepID=UPI003704B3C1
MMRSALLLLLLFCALAQAAPVRYQLVSNLTAPAEMLIASEKNPWRDRTLRVGIISPPCQDSCRLELKNFRGPETTKMNTYSPERKAALIARMMPPHNQSVVQLA